MKRVAYAREFFSEVECVPEMPGEQLTNREKHHLGKVQLTARICRNIHELGGKIEQGSMLRDGLDYRQWMQDPAYEHQHVLTDHVLFSIDVSLSNSLIVNQLLIGIEKAREYLRWHGAEVQDRGNDEEVRLRRWITQSVLPYIGCGVEFIT